MPFHCPSVALLLTSTPFHQADRAAWEPLLKRATFELAHDAVYVDGPPKTTPKGALQGTPERRLHVHNGFALWARQDAGELGIAKDVDALKEAVRTTPDGQLPAALARLTGVYDLPACRLLPPVATSKPGFFSRLFGFASSDGGAKASSAHALPLTFHGRSSALP